MDVSTTAVVPGGAALGRAPDGRVVARRWRPPRRARGRSTIRVRTQGRVARRRRRSSRTVARPRRPAVRVPAGGVRRLPVATRRPGRAAAAQARRSSRTRCAGSPISPTLPFQPTVTLPVEAYRTTVRALVIDGRPAFRRRHAHDAVPVERCLVAHPLVDDILQHGHFGRAREITVRAGVGNRRTTRARRSRTHARSPWPTTCEWADART